MSGRLSAQNQNSAEATISAMPTQRLMFTPAALSSADASILSMAGATSTPAKLLLKPPIVDRRLAYKNLRTGLIAGAISIIIFASAWVVGLVY